MGRKEVQYKGENVEKAIEKGLTDLGLTENEVEIEVVSEEGFLKKATVKISFEEKEEGQESSEEAESVEEEEEKEEVAETEEVEDAFEEERTVDKEVLEEVEKKSFGFVKELIEIMGVDCEVSSSVSQDSVLINIDGPEARIIIGKRGEVLDAIQYLALTIGNKGEKEFVRVTVDSEKYREKRKGTLERVAENNARKALKYGEVIELEPMNPFERRIIHTTLMEEKKVVTRSEGEGRERHVIIIPLNENGEEITKRFRERARNQYEYGTTNEFRRNGVGKMKSYGQPKRRF